MNKILLSFVIPCYRSEHTIKKVIDEIISTVSQRENFDYEIIAVSDDSPDNVFEVLKELAANNSRIKAASLTKNMGKHCAVMAGYSFVKGDYIVNLDDDFQCPVNELWKLVDPVIADECDIATAHYFTKKEAAWKRFGSSVNLWISSIMLDRPRNIEFENFSVVKRFVCDEVIKYKNPFPFLSGLFWRVTKRVIAVPMEGRERGDSQGTGFTFWKSLALFANGLTSFSVKPLRVASIMGFIFALSGFIYGLVIIITKLLHPNMIMGWSSIMAIILFSNGMIMLMLGMIGEYVGRIFICINDAPQYVIRSTVNLDSN